MNDIGPSVAKLAEKNRFFDEKSKNKGRVEVILESGKAIFIKNLEDSKAWYALTDREEKIGNPYASWIGVPIWDKKKVLGVIAVYHPTEEYMYEKADLNFLVEISDKASGLLRELDNTELKLVNKKLEKSILNNTELNRVNKQLEQAKGKIADQQHALSTALLAQDLTHRLNNTIGAISINISQTERDIKLAQSSLDMTHFSYTLEALSDINEMIQELVDETQNISNDSLKKISINDLLIKIVNQVRFGKKLDSFGVNIILDVQEVGFFITAHYRMIFNAFYSIINNSAEALIEMNKINKKSVLNLSVEVVEDNNYIKIMISDTGVPVPKQIKPHLFEYGSSSKGSSGFGLWRAKSVFCDLDGTIHYEEKISQKYFVIKIPIKSTLDKKIAIIVDDEKSWRTILNRWLTEAGFETYLAGDKQGMIECLEVVSNPSHVFLDVSLDTEDGANNDGISLIDIVRSSSPQAKLTMVTGYRESIENYESDVDLILDKIDASGVILSSDFLLSKLEELRNKS